MASGGRTRGGAQELIQVNLFCRPRVRLAAWGGSACGQASRRASQPDGGRVPIHSCPLQGTREAPMRGITHIAALAAAVLMGLALLASPARAAGDSAIKSLMGDNFQNIQIMLFNLVTAKYDKLLPQVKTIHDHALELSKKPPATVKSDVEKRTFVTYAYQLESNTANMMTVMDALLL